MTIDTSAIAAIAFEEPTAGALYRAMVADPYRMVSAMSVLEATLVLQRAKGALAVEWLAEFLDDFQIRKVPFDDAQLAAAQSAFLRFGRGRHRARLNFGDCASYALASTSREPLLFTGGDFAQTDLALVAY